MAISNPCNKKWSFLIDRGGTFTDIIAINGNGQLIAKKQASTRTDNMHNPVRSKRVKLKKPSLEISIEQKLGMLDQVLSSVQKPKEDNQQN